MRRKLSKIGKELAPFVLIFLVQFFGSEALMFVAVLAASALTLIHKYHHREILLFALGVILGLLIEVALGLFFREQYWVTDTFLGVPAWLPFVWGYGFVVIRRVGDIVVGWK